MRKGFIAGAVIALMIAGVLAVNAASGGKLGEQLFNLARAIAGERNASSITGTDYLSVSPECKMSATIDLSTDASTTVYAGPALLCNVWLSTTIGTEAATIDDSSTAKVTLPLALPIGSHQFNGARFDTSLVLNPGTNSTGVIMLEYRPLDSAQVTY
ncbi:MAG: hypothetical protein RJA36_3925 [Pseudomonadota bacterium]|jgi:hypothetical protein